ncbi:unnamed protein product [Larinioides sclopetarius]|uniref:Cuticle protein 16.8 n=1 Tax=Larinioides sclopetarius TaxID=280406 RepID=A0AAV2AAP3_9ARAC
MISQAFILAILSVTAFASLHHEPVHHASQPYKFGYSVKDKHGEQHREEVGDGKNVKGSYGFTDARGIHRQVNYVADHAGFRAQVKTNEPGTANQNPAAVQIISDTPYGHGVAGLGYGVAGASPLGNGYGVAGASPLGNGYGVAGASPLGNGYGVAGTSPLGNGYGVAGGAGLGYAGAARMGNGVISEAGLGNGYTNPAGLGGSNLGSGFLSGD